MMDIVYGLASESQNRVEDPWGLGGSVIALGLAVVFTGLVALILIIKIYPPIVKAIIEKAAAIRSRKNAKKEKRNLNESKADSIITTQQKKSENDKELVAVITAAIASMLGKSSNGIVIRSLRRSGQNSPAWGKEARNEQVYNKF